MIQSGGAGYILLGSKGGICFYIGRAGALADREAKTPCMTRCMHVNDTACVL